MEKEKEKKLETAKKIWKTYLKTGGVNKTAKELNVNKNVVSNIINYTLPDFYFYNYEKEKLMEELKKEYEKDYNRALNIKIQEAKEQEEEKINFVRLTGLFFFILSPVLFFVLEKLNLYNINNFYCNYGGLIFALIYYVITSVRTKNWIF
jgi:hypothetical protein